MLFRSQSAEPSMAEIQLQLVEMEFEVGNNSGSMAWLVEGLNIEKAQ